VVSCLIIWESAESNPGYVHDIVMYITCLDDRYVWWFLCKYYLIFITSL
jgi:hypothetical protein